MKVSYTLLALLAGASRASAQREGYERPSLEAYRSLASKEALVSEIQFKLKAAIPVDQVETRAQQVAEDIHASRGAVRIFPHAGRFEVDHVAAGLHLWYKASLDLRELETETERSHRVVDVFEQMLNSSNHLDLIDSVAPGHKKKLYASWGNNTPPMNDPSLASQDFHYGPDGIDVYPAWEVQAGDPSIVVQVIDSGLDVDHPDLQINRWQNPGETCGDGEDNDGNNLVDDCHGYNFANDRSNLLGDGSHGMHCTGTIAADNDNGVGLCGVAGGKDGSPGVSIMTSTVFGENNAVSGFEQALVYGADQGANVSSNSWGYTGPDYVDESVLDAIDYANNKSVYVVFAAGNDGTNDKWYPAYYPGVIAVAAIDTKESEFEAASFTNYGDWVDISAPGVSIQSTVSEADGWYGGMSGTSMACPHISGMIALALSHNPDASREHIMYCMKSTALDLDEYNPMMAGMLGAGMARMPEFLACSATMTPTTSPTLSMAPTITRSPTSAPTQLGEEILCHTLELHDSYGDGWNGAHFFWSLVRPGGSLITLSSGTMNSGSYAEADVCTYSSSLEYSLSITAGRYPDEISWKLISAIDNEVVDEGSDIPLDDHRLELQASAQPSSSPAPSGMPTAKPTGSPTATRNLLECFDLKMIDSYGDGWNDASWTWIIELPDGQSNELATGTLLLGSRETVTDALCIYDTSTSYTIRVSSGGWPDEITWKVKNDDGVLFSGGAPAEESYEYVLPPTPAPTSSSVCRDDPSWRRRNKPDQGCDWVAQSPTDWRCKQKSSDGVYAREACPGSCNSCPPEEYVCEDDPDWVAARHSWLTCTAVALQPNNWRCSQKNSEGITAKEACRAACDACPNELCEDDRSWFVANAPLRDCDWVSMIPNNWRCSRKNSEGIAANDACPVACGNCQCENDNTWFASRNIEQDCDWVANKPNRYRCFDSVNRLGVTAKTACPVACSTHGIRTSHPTCVGGCQNSEDWFRRGKSNQDCDWVARKPNTWRCNYALSFRNINAAEACPVACGTCPE